MSNEILENVANFQRRGSGWIFRKVLSMDIHLNKYEPLSGSTNMNHSVVPHTFHFQKSYRARKL